MYQVELRRSAYKDLENLPAEYLRLISKHIDSLEQNPRPVDSKKLKGDAGYSLRIGAYRVLYDSDDLAGMTPLPPLLGWLIPRLV